MRKYYKKWCYSITFFNGLGLAIAKEDNDYFILIACISIEISIYKPKKHTYYENLPKNN